MALWTDARGNYSPVETLTCNQRVPSLTYANREPGPSSKVSDLYQTHDIERHAVEREREATAILARDAAPDLYECGWTPGPWKLWATEVRSAAPQYGGNEVQRDNSDLVAVTFQRDAHGHPITCDASLIAAAPDLYTALVNLAPNNCWCNTAIRDHTPECRAARAALAKARGETA